MTIAACYVCGEGVVFGADSTTSVLVAGTDSATERSERYFEHAQKLFEIGENSTLGMVTWGMGNLGDVSHRTLISLFADDLQRAPAATMLDVAQRWNTFFWNAYAREMQAALQRVQHLLGLTQPTEAERAELVEMKEGLSGGFCLGGYLRPDRAPQAFVIQYNPTLSAGTCQPVEPGTPRFWGVSNVLERVVRGMDLAVFSAILRSGHWTGSPDDLAAILAPYMLGQPATVPIREALDWIHSAIEITIKAIKFSHLPPTCGGSVELAIITTDRTFRWVRHKPLGSALGTGDSSHG